jgi:hypothetical protein
MERRQF